MNCSNCNSVLAPNARFCPVCGSAPASPGPSAEPLRSVSDAPTLLQSLPTPGQWSSPAGEPQQVAPWPARPQVAQQFAQPPPPYMASRPQTGVAPARQQPQTRSRWQGCLLRSGIVLVLLLVLLTGGWFFALRPYLHSFAENEIGQVLSSAMNEINPIAAALVPAGLPLPIPESLITAALVLPPSSSFSIQDVQLSITPENISFSFQVQVALFTFSCAVITVPQVANGQATIKTLSLSGPISLVISADDIKTEVNSYLKQLQGRINRPLASLALEDHFLLVTLG